MADPTRRGFRARGTTTQPMVVSAGGNGTPISTFGYDHQTIWCTACGAGGEGQVQVSPVETGDVWTDYGSAMNSVGDYITLSVPSFRVRVQQKAATTGSYQFVQEVL